MTKIIFLYASIFFSLFLVSFFLHESLIEKNEIILPFSLLKVYLYHLGFSLLICINFQVLSTVDKVFTQLGFIYLGTIILKIVLFSAFFYKPVFTEENLSQIARVSLFIPMLLFLLTEVVFISKILNKKE